ncbi:hypothetical protein K8R43_00875 [archaeon]|nr:hypothetical protein [archaeon]
MIMLAVLGSVTFPKVNSMTDFAGDASMAVSLAAGQRRIINTAEEVSLGGCGSFKTIGVYMPISLIAYPNLLWNETHVWGNFTDSNHTVIYMKPLVYPSYIKITGGTCNTPPPPSSPGACTIEENVYSIKIEKDCSLLHPTVDLCLNGDTQSGIGLVVC